MDGLRLGKVVRALRHRLGWRQADLAARAGVSQSLISLVERGHVDAIAVGRLVAILRALDAELVLLARWRGGDLDRLLDEAHATIVGAVARLLAAAQWAVEVEVTYAIDRERGSIDLVAWHPTTRTLLVVEVKSELVSVEETLRRHDAKARLAARIVGERFGWQPRQVARLLVLPDGSTPRRRVERHAAILDRAYPRRGADARAWLRSPTGAEGILLFVAAPDMRTARGRRSAPTRKRVRRTSAPDSERGREALAAAGPASGRPHSTYHEPDS